MPADLQGFEQNAMRYAVTQMLRGKRTGHTKPIFLRQLPAACQHAVGQAYRADARKNERPGRAAPITEELEAKRSSTPSMLEVQQRQAEAWGYVTAMSAAKERQDQHWVQEPPQSIGFARNRQDPMSLMNIVKRNAPPAHQQKSQASGGFDSLHVTSKEPMNMLSPHKVNFCRYCGKPRISSHVFCPHCGSKII